MIAIDGGGIGTHALVDGAVSKRPATCSANLPWPRANLTMVALHASPETAERALHAAFYVVALIDELMSLYRPESQLSRLNREGVLGIRTHISCPSCKAPSACRLRPMGFALDCALAALSRHGVDHALVDIGELGALGRKESEAPGSSASSIPRRPTRSPAPVGVRTTDHAPGRVHVTC